MQAYYVMIGALLIGVLLSSFNKTLNNIYFFASAMSIYFVLSMRSLNVDRDAYVYDLVFNKLGDVDFYDILSYSSLVGQEIGFITLMKVLNSLGADFFEFRFVYNLICLIALSYILFRYVPAKYRLISYMVYVSMFILFREFTQIRLALACLFAMISILKCLDGLFFKSIIFCLLAICFHNTALIIVPIIIFLTICKNYIFFYSPFFVVIIIFIGFILVYFNPVEHLISLSIMPSQLTRYEGTEELKSTGEFGISFFIAMFLSFVLSINFRACIAKTNYKVLYWSMLFSLLASCAFYYSPILMRMQVLLFTGIIFMPSVTYEYFLPRSRVVNYSFQVMLGFAFLLYFLKNLSSGIVYPYGVY